MNILKSTSLALLIFSTLNLFGQEKSKMDAFINELMGKMTLEEKIGQLNLVTAGEATTGSVVSSNVENNIKAGKIGGIFSMSSPERSVRRRN